jgi:hypothetical protein
MAVTNRVVDYCAFAVRFIGLGYLVLWPFSTPDPFGLARFCRPDTPLQRFFYHWPQLVTLTPGLHLIGILCASYLAIRLLFRRRARALHANGALTPSVNDPATLAGTPQRAPLVKPRPKVKPRSEFGLRGSARRLRDSEVDLPTRRSRAAVKTAERN